MIWTLLDLVSILLTIHALLSLRFMLHAWETADQLAGSGAPASFSTPDRSFTVLLPARHEEAVIYETIRQVWNTNYPKRLMQAIIICHASDTATIAEAERAMSDIGSPNIAVVTFSDPPINKPHGLNVGLRQATNDIVTIFDAEDDINPDIFNIINSRFQQQGLGDAVIQAGVQLINFRDHWFGLHNCLEYFFWYKSRMHLHAEVGMMPLGGNTAFIPRGLLEVVGGWNDQCLTEDAELGVRLSLLDLPIQTIYEPRYATREETPHSLGQFVRQRTRWNQGFLQVLRIRAWWYLPGWKQSLLAVYTLAYPLAQAFFMVLLPFDLASAIWLRPSALAAMITFLPLYALMLQLVALVVGAYEFAREYQLKLPWHTPLYAAITYLPFLFIQAYSSLRALAREFSGAREWEKTAHIGAHRRAGALESPLA